MRAKQRREGGEEEGPSSPPPSHLWFALAPFPAHPKFGNRLWCSENATETLSTQASLTAELVNTVFTATKLAGDIDVYGYRVREFERI